MLNAFLQFFNPPFTPKRSRVIAASEKGNVREENQDNYLLVTPSGKAQYLHNENETDGKHQSWKDNVYRLAVADGMGGHKGGREISEALIQQLLQLKPQKSPQKLKEKLTTIHYQLQESFTQEHDKSPGTTLVMADVYESGTAIIANIGDSRAYLWRDNSWKCITYDQTLTEYDWRDGELDDEDYNSTDKSNSLSQAIGYGSYGLIKDDNGFKPRQANRYLRLDLVEDLPEDKQTHADIFKIKLQKGDALLLASDGLWGAVKEDETFKLPHPERLINAEDLLGYFWKEVLEKGGTDNITMVMLWSPR